jgi:16S rRNA (guanine527-N7)-methyltransferase
MDTNDRAAFRQAMATVSDALGVHLDPSQVDRMYQHLNLVLLANENFNLTRVTDPAEAAVRMVGDSLALLPWATKRLADRSVLRVLDMGTGAGYPSIPLAIARPEWMVTAVDPAGKKVRFLAKTAAELGLHNYMVEQVQAREWHGKVAPFDLVVTRAMGDLSVVVREGARLTRPDGLLVSYHAEDVSPAEAKAAAQMMKRYKMQEVDSFEYSLPDPKKSVRRRLIVVGRQPLTA